MSLSFGFRRLFRLRNVALSLALLALVPLPLPHHRAHAQTAPEAPLFDDLPQSTPEGDSSGEGFSLMEEGAKLLLRGLFTELEPTLNEMDQALRELAPQLEAIGPQLSEVARLMGDFRNYDMPVMLENGDILIRRNSESPPPPGLRNLLPEAEPAPRLPRTSPQPGPGGQIDL